MPREAEDLSGRVIAGRRITGRAADRLYDGSPVIYYTAKCLACGKRAEVQAGTLRRGVGCRCGQRVAASAAPPFSVAALRRATSAASPKGRVLVAVASRGKVTLAPARAEITPTGDIVLVPIADERKAKR